MCPQVLNDSNLCLVAGSGSRRRHLVLSKFNVDYSNNKIEARQNAITFVFINSQMVDGCFCPTFAQYTVFMYRNQVEIFD